MTKLPDFDTLKWLAENKPEQLAHLQTELSEEAIASSRRNQAQLKSLVFNYHQQLSRCANPYHRCQMAMYLMSEKLTTLSHVINEPTYIKDQTAEIIPFNGN